VGEQGRDPGKSTERLSLLPLLQALKDQISEKEGLLKAKSRELVSQRDFVENVIASMSDSVVVVAPDGKIQSANPATHELLGYREGELVGRSGGMLWASPDAAARFEGAGFDRLLAGPKQFSTELAYRARSGEAIPVRWQGSPIQDAEGATRGFVQLAHDLRGEHRLQEEKLKAVRTMAASVAHEIRNPLGAIQNSAALLIRDLKLEGDDLTLLEIVYKETRRISSIVNDFLRFARPPAASLQRGSLQPLVEETLTLLRQDERFTERHRIVVDLPYDLPAVPRDPHKVKQVLWNLLSNSLDAMPGLGLLRIEGQPSAAGGILLALSDDGPGFPADMLARAFEPFVTSKTKGTGLGLAIVRALMDAHRGSVSIETAAGQGTKFVLNFPPGGKERE